MASGASTISISANREDHLKAAKALSNHLKQLGCNHAFIGGFAWSLLGSDRPTEDIDVLIETKNVDLLVVREQLMKLDAHFARAGIKLYFVQNPDEEVLRDELVRKSKNNVMIETLSTGMLGLPVTAGPTYEVPEFSVMILHPCILILTKFKRWSTSHTSTRPKTIRKMRSDREDINFLIKWLAERKITIKFELYHGKTKPELLRMVRSFQGKYEGNTTLMEMLRSIMPDDWEEMLSLPLEVEDMMPPVA